MKPQLSSLKGAAKNIKVQTILKQISRHLLNLNRKSRHILAPEQRTIQQITPSDILKVRTTPLYEKSARGRDLYLTTHNTHN